MGAGAVLTVGQEHVTPDLLLIGGVDQFNQVTAVGNPGGRQGLLPLLRAEFAALIAPHGGQAIHRHDGDVNGPALQGMPLLVELPGGLAHPGFNRQRDKDAHLQRLVGGWRRDLPTGGPKDGRPRHDQQGRADDHEKDHTGAIHGY